MKVITIELKDKIIEYIIENRNGAMFSIEDGKSEALFDLNEGLIFSFLKELEGLGYIRNLVGYDSGATAFTKSSLDTFYLQGGFLKHYSIKDLLENKLLYEVDQILREGDKKDKNEILAKIKGLLPIIDTAVNVITMAVGD